MLFFQKIAPQLSNHLSKRNKPKFFFDCRENMIYKEKIIPYFKVLYVSLSTQWVETVCVGDGITFAPNHWLK